jgi:hypothetical protein
MRARTGSLAGVLSLVAVGLLGASAQGAAGQDAVDGRWLPWLGCWVPAEAMAEDAPLTCIRPAADGVEFLTIAGGEVAERQLIQADGVQRAADVADCPGTQSALFSADGARVYLQAERACAGSIGRVTRGLMAMVDGDRWVEVRSMAVNDGSVAWVRRHVPAPRARVEAAGFGDLLLQLDRRAGSIELARMAAAAPVGVDEILEAFGHTDAEVVRSWVAEHGQLVALDARRLVRLADAGLPGDVIDVIVAVSYPQRFALAEPEGERAAERPLYGSRRPGYWDPWYSPYGYGGYGLYSPYRMGFGYWDMYGYGGYWNRPPVIVVPADPGQPTERGGMVRGRGVTGASGGSSAQPSTRSETPRAATPRSGASATSRPSGASPSASGASSGASRPAAAPSTSGSGSSTPRTAVPRGGGGGGD